MTIEEIKEWWNATDRPALQALFVADVIDTLLAEVESLHSDSVLCTIPTIRVTKARYMCDGEGKEWLEFPDGSGCGIYEWTFYDAEARKLLDRAEAAEQKVIATSKIADAHSNNREVWYNLATTAISDLAIATEALHDIAEGNAEDCGDCCYNTRAALAALKRMKG